MADKKKIICPKCKAKLKFDPDKLVSEVIKFKCPGCQSIIRFKNPAFQQETPPPSATDTPTGLLIESSTEQLETLRSSPVGSEPEIRKEVAEGYHTDKGEELKAPVSEKTKEDFSTAPEPLPEDQGPLIPDDKIVPLKPPGDSVPEDYDHEKLRDSEKGEVGEGDLGRARHADSKKSLISKSKIGLNVPPASKSGLQPPPADLQQSETYNLQGEHHLEKNRDISKKAAPKRIICPRCKARLEFDLDKFVSEVIKFKCTGCQFILRIKNPAFQKETPPPSTTGRSTDLAKESSTEQLETLRSSQVGSEPEIRREVAEGYHTDKGEELKSPVSEKTKEGFSTAPEPLPEDQDPLIPDDKIVPLKPPGDSVLEDYDHEKLRDYEEGEAEDGDLEWTRYAASKRPSISVSKIDLNVIPASESRLQDTLADLQQSETYNLQGEHHLGKNRVKQALRDFNHALEINPDYVAALVNRGSAYTLLSKYNDALKDFNHALEINNRQAEIYNLRGEIYLLNKMYDQATRDFTAAIILNPIYRDAFLNRARAYTEKGMEEEADADYNQAIKASPENFSDYDDLETSESLFDEESSFTKEKAVQYYQQGLEDLKKEKYNEAIENLTEAINLSPKEAGPFVCRGQAYIELGQPDEAMVDLNQAVIYDPLIPVLYYWRAMAWKALDSPINLVADLKISCELGYEPACEKYLKHKPQKH